MRRNNVTHQSAQNEDCYNRKVIFQNYERINEKIYHLFNMYSKEKTLFDLKMRCSLWKQITKLDNRQNYADFHALNIFTILPL